MTAEHVVFPSDDLTLHGLYQSGRGTLGVVVAHPHPLYGGAMDNPVVETLAASYSRAGYSVLRFNFRGVGCSTGAFDNGIGETADLVAAMAFLADQGHERVCLAGYSFGAWVMAHMSDPPVPVDHMVMISPPVAFMDFSAAGRLPALSLVVTGRLDTYAPPDAVKAHLAEWNPSCRYHELPMADHFYWGQFPELESVVDEFLSDRERPAAR